MGYGEFKEDEIRSLQDRSTSLRHKETVNTLSPDQISSRNSFLWFKRTRLTNDGYVQGAGWEETT
jgi:hypothetical protein